MSELTVTLLRFGFLALLWVFVVAIVLSQGRDLAIDRRRRGSKAGRNSSARAQTGTPQGAQAPPPAQAPRQLPQTLVVLQGPTSGRTYQLGSAPVLMGRSPESTVPLEDDYASGRHARLFPQGSRWFLEDLGSTNGTYVNEQRLTRAVAVEAGQPFRVGKSILELRS
ncbi:FHA domain-containing protein FhaB/FipA [Kocuria sp.]|uniref:FHA domain-containing protein FhaB/FipA n=1 Tax=Kocuria sp. TaxID=1871328 RepID=UPI0026E01053|nr:FHA domain-containing protein [Kocuria sp.]MDO5619736.1 FHA domain-containing protein [Kocuria sp.]